MCFDWHLRSDVCCSGLTLRVKKLSELKSCVKLKVCMSNAFGQYEEVEIERPVTELDK